jgi:dipeptidyl aminopeptidase/acylaminoacyl peptidase
VNFAEFVRPEAVKFPSFDGLELSGWLYKPKNQKGPCAYVIDFHGGPEAQAKPTSQFQPFLSQGIGVFAPNIRGSSGRGKAFADLDNGALRVNAVKDIESCADFLVTNGIADPKRLGIMGHSGGGYLAMAGVTEFPRLFAAGCDSNGPIDRVAETKRARAKGNPANNPEFGDLAEEMLKKMSPAYNVDRIEVPIMILQGEHDDATPDTDEMVKKLKQRGIPVEYIVSANEGHNLYKIENRIKTGTAKVEFFVKYLHPAAQN